MQTEGARRSAGCFSDQGRERGEQSPDCLPEELLTLTSSMKESPHRSQLLLGGEPVQLAIADGPHQGGLAGTIGPAQTIPLAPLQVQAGIVEQDLATCRRRLD